MSRILEAPDSEIKTLLSDPRTSAGNTGWPRCSYRLPILTIWTDLEDRCDQITELASGNDTGCEDGQTPNDGEVASPVFGCQDLVVDESNQKVGLLGGRATSWA